jgi:hypothetical protein
MGRRKNTRYEVSYALVGDDGTITKEIEAHDPACALGTLLDELDDEADGECPELAFVAIRRHVRGKLPVAIKRAYELGLQGD